jgi:hypothetical protein
LQRFEHPAARGEEFEGKGQRTRRAETTCYDQRIACGRASSCEGCRNESPDKQKKSRIADSDDLKPLDRHHRDTIYQENEIAAVL